MYSKVSRIRILEQMRSYWSTSGQYFHSILENQLSLSRLRIWVPDQVYKTVIIELLESGESKIPERIDYPEKINFRYNYSGLTTGLTLLIQFVRKNFRISFDHCISVLMTITYSLLPTSRIPSELLSDERRHDVKIPNERIIRNSIKSNSHYIQSHNVLFEMRDDAH